MSPEVQSKFIDVSPLIRDGPGTGFEFREVPDAPVFSYGRAAHCRASFFSLRADSFRKYFAVSLADFSLDYSNYSNCTKLRVLLIKIDISKERNLLYA